MSASSRPPIELTPNQRWHMQVINLTRYFDITDDAKFLELKRLCADFLEKIVYPLPEEECYLKDHAENTHTFIVKLHVADAAFQKLVALKKIDNSEIAFLFNTINEALQAYHMCLQLTFKQNFLSLSALVPLKEKFLAKVIELEELNRHFLARCVNDSLQLKSFSQAQSFLNRIQLANENILACITRLDDKKFRQEKNNAESSLRSVSTFLYEIEESVRKEKAAEAKIVKPTPQFFAKSAVSAVDSLDLLIDKMQANKLSSRPKK